MKTKILFILITFFFALGLRAQEVTPGGTVPLYLLQNFTPLDTGEIGQLIGLVDYTDGDTLFSFVDVKYRNGRLIVNGDTLATKDELGSGTIYDPQGNAFTVGDTINFPTVFKFQAANDLSGFFPPLAVYINGTGQLQPANRSTLRKANFILVEKSGNLATLMSEGVMAYNTGIDGNYWTGDGGLKLSTLPSDTIQFLYEKLGDSLYVNVEPNFRYITNPSRS